MNSNSGHWFYLGHRPIMDDKVEHLHTVVVARDITALKNTQERLLKSEEELKKRIGELERFYEMAVGRELKMKQLKNEIKSLKEELDDNNEYP